MSPEEKIEAAQKLIDEARAEIAAKKRNWPEKIEPGMLFRHNGGALYVSCFPLGDERLSLVRLNSASKTWKNGTLCGLDGFGISGDKAFVYLGYACDLIRIADDAHEPTGAELVGVLEDIRNVSNNPGQTLTPLGLTECLESCNVMARKALEGLAK